MNNSQYRRNPHLSHGILCLLFLVGRTDVIPIPLFPLYIYMPLNIYIYRRHGILTFGLEAVSNCSREWLPSEDDTMILYIWLRIDTLEVIGQLARFFKTEWWWSCDFCFPYEVQRQESRPQGRQNPHLFPDSLVRLLVLLVLLSRAIAVFLPLCVHRYENVLTAHRCLTLSLEVVVPWISLSSGCTLVLWWKNSKWTGLYQLLLLTDPTVAVIPALNISLPVSKERQNRNMSVTLTPAIQVATRWVFLLCCFQMFSTVSQVNRCWGPDAGCSNAKSLVYMIHLAGPDMCGDLQTHQLPVERSLCTSPIVGVSGNEEFSGLEFEVV